MLLALHSPFLKQYYKQPLGLTKHAFICPLCQIFYFTNSLSVVKVVSLPLGVIMKRSTGRRKRACSIKYYIFLFLVKTTKLSVSFIAAINFQWEPCCLFFGPWQSCFPWLWGSASAQSQWVKKLSPEQPQSCAGTPCSLQFSFFFLYSVLVLMKVFYSEVSLFFICSSFCIWGYF